MMSTRGSEENNFMGVFVKDWSDQCYIGQVSGNCGVNTIGPGAIYQAILAFHLLAESWS